MSDRKRHFTGDADHERDSALPGTPDVEWDPYPPGDALPGDPDVPWDPDEESEDDQPEEEDRDEREEREQEKPRAGV